MASKVTNNAATTIAGSINTVVTTINLAAGTGALFPTLSAGDWFYGTLIDASNNLEVVKVTARATDALTVTRGQDNTTARSYTVGDRFELRPTAALFNDKADVVSPSFTTKITTPAITLGSTALTATGTELNYVAGVTSAIQTQFNDLITSLALKAALASPTFTGVPAAPTAAVSTSTTQLATTAFVMGQTANTSRIGLAEAATSAEALGGTDSTRFVTSSGLASDKTFSGTGHYVLPGGFIINWVASGTLSADTNITVSFDKPFTVTCFGTVATLFNSSTTDDDTAVRVLANSLTSTTLRAEGMSAAHSGTRNIFAISLGY